MNHGVVVNEIQAMLHGAEPPVSIDCCIYRVPSDIRILNEDAYAPKVVSIGPFHHRTLPRLQNMERHKLIYCKAFLERAFLRRPEVSLETFIHCIENVEPKFRRCYSDTLQLPKEDLVKLILVDSCFILELFWRSYHKEWSADDHAFLLKPYLYNRIGLDLVLLENQLPYFVLENLFNLSFSSPSFLELTFKYFPHFNYSRLAPDNNISNIRHLADVIRIFHLQHLLERRPPRNAIYGAMKHRRSATELLEAGVMFKVNTERHCLMDLRFSGGVLEIPQLTVGDSTEVLIRNTVALEQCHYPNDSYITDYIIVLDLLINTSRDVDILVQNGILVNWLGDSDSVANMVNSLFKNVTQSSFSSDYVILCEKLNAFCRDPFNKLKATLRRDYCNTPWQTAASIAGIILLVLSLVQSVCSVLQVVKQ